MAKRTICIQNPAKLSVKDGSLVVTQGERAAAIPLEDIWVLILETHLAQISVAALSRMVDAGIGVMLCGEDHMPNGLFLPIGAHSRHAAIVEDQLAISKPLRKRLWQAIVQSKITNQARVLDLVGEDGSHLRTIAKEVCSGDTTNRESVAASEYFRHLIPEGNRRRGPYTAAFDYGYSVLRAGIGRTAVSGGWLVSRGIHHSNNLNAFNLVDDLIEPFRPIVDLLVITADLGGEMTPEVKRRLAEIFEYQVQIDVGLASVQTAIEAELNSLRAAVLNGDASRLVLPGAVPLRRVGFE